MSETTRPYRDEAPSAHPLARLREPGTVRARCQSIMQSVLDGVSPHFRLELSRLDVAADRVAALTLRRYPDLNIPFHSRWRHFEAGGIDRKAEMDERLAGRDVADIARARIDLTVVSVLLDAGAGPQWRYLEGETIDRMALPLQQRDGDELLALLDRVAGGKAGDTGAGAAAGVTAEEAAEAETETSNETATDSVAATATDPAPDAKAATPAPPAPEPTDAVMTPASDSRSWSRSEGLGVASFRAFMAGAFSTTRGEPLRADATALKAVDAPALRAMFQANPTNPLQGLEGRAGLIARLGEAVAAEAARTGLPARPGLLYDLLTDSGRRTEVTATEVLSQVLRIFAPIWRSGSNVQGLTGGDVWPHHWAGARTGTAVPDATTTGWVPFHKLSQWLVYSLIEPLQWAGVKVTGLDELTGLPEYRNGGLLLDCGVIVPRRPSDLGRSWKTGDEFIVEWRALTVVLLDRLADRVRARLGRTAEELPLACILEGGTWAAGREIAAELRPGGPPPLRIDSDGTVF